MSRPLLKKTSLSVSYSFLLMTKSRELSGKLISAILTIFCCCPVALNQQETRPRTGQACPSAWQVSPADPKLTEKSDAWVSASGYEDGITMLQFCWVFQSGLTMINRIGIEKLKELPVELEPYRRHAQLAGEKIRVDDLPIGFSIYKNLAFELKTAATMTGPSVTLRLPSVRTEEEFDRLVLLHLDEDSLVPGTLQWQQYGALGQQKSDFKTRTLTAEFRNTTIFHQATGMARLVVASFNKEEYDRSAVDLSITSAVGPPYVNLGEKFKYAISIRNWGGSGRAASDVVVNSTLRGALFVSGSATQGTCRQSINSTPVVVCELGKVEYGKTVTMTLTLKSDDLGMGKPDEKEFVFFANIGVRSREKDNTPENDNHQSLGTIVRRQ